jgi:hypothetical protein
VLLGHVLCLAIAEGPGLVSLGPGAGQVPKRLVESERLWLELEQLAHGLSLPERTISAMYDAVSGLRVRNAVYRATFEDSGEEITEQTASRDLRQLMTAGLLIPTGQSRGCYYTAGETFSRLRREITEARDPWDDSDPFAPAS